jgi:hypothetical protein
MRIVLGKANESTPVQLLNQLYLYLLTNALYHNITPNSMLLYNQGKCGNPKASKRNPRHREAKALLCKVSQLCQLIQQLL